MAVEVVQGRVSVAGTAQIEARRMSSRLSTLKPMGSYRVTITGGAVTSLGLETLDGALRLSGNGQWAGARLRFGGLASAEPGSETALSNLLNIIGRRDGARSIITVG
jgi:general secretion pathway protein N